MLAYILAILVGSGSVGLYIAAFFFPEIHRKNDFIWSGVGFFYALFLWIYARQITGGVLVGQTASVTLIGWFVWQTVKLRRQIVPANQQTPLPTTGQIQAQLGLKPTATKADRPQAKSESQPPSQPKPPAATPQPPVTAKVPNQSKVAPTPPQPNTTPTAPPSTTTLKPVTPPTAPPQPTVAAPSPTTPPKVPTQPPPIAETTEPGEAWIELQLTPPQPRDEKPLGQAIQPPISNPIPKPEATKSVPSQPDAPLPPPRTPVDQPIPHPQPSATNNESQKPDTE